MIEKFEDEYKFLSNFYPSTVWYEGIPFNTVEHAYQAAKTKDFDSQMKIAEASSPAKAKRLGRKVEIRSDWESIKIEVMTALLKQKFQGKLRQMLLDTGEKILIEGNWWKDYFWGVCDDVGENHLGKILMSIRQDMRDGTD